MNVKFSEKPTKEIIPFKMFLTYPSKFEVKCLLNSAGNKLTCSRTLSDENDELPSMLQLPYPFPTIEEIQWDYETFLTYIYRQVYTTDPNCEEEDTVLDWGANGKIGYLENGNCQPAKTVESNIHHYYFDMFINLSSGSIINNLGGGSVELLQEIWVPLLTNSEVKKDKENPTYERNFPFAYCSANNKITKANVANIKLNCDVPIQYYSEFKGTVKIKPFFDVLFVKLNNGEIKSISIHVSTSQDAIMTLDEGIKGIICPNIPILNIPSSKEGITMINFYPSSNEYAFSLKGTISNGYYVYQNGTIVELSETYKDIQFDLLVQDNLYKSKSTGDVLVSCVLPKGTEYDEKNGATVTCRGKKDSAADRNNNVDIVLNWELKENNNLGNIIIIWPFEYGGSVKKKNLFAYELTALSIRQKDFGCRYNNFYFYVYLYNIGSEPKINFELPMQAPALNAECKVFNKRTLKCNLNLKHNKIFKGYKVTLPNPGEVKEIYTLGNIVKFTMANYSQINNDHDFYVVAEEECGDFMMVGTLKDMGMSHGGSVFVTIGLILFIIICIGGIIGYLIYRVRLRYKRGKKLTASEETKSVPNTSKV